MSVGMSVGTVGSVGKYHRPKVFNKKLHVHNFDYITSSPENSLLIETSHSNCESH